VCADCCEPKNGSWNRQGAEDAKVNAKKYNIWVSPTGRILFIEFVFEKLGDLGALAV
jgi:hypothetical protein